MRTQYGLRVFHVDGKPTGKVMLLSPKLTRDGALADARDKLARLDGVLRAVFFAQSFSGRFAKPISERIELR